MALNGGDMRLEVLKKRRDFLAVAATGQRWAAPGLVLQVRRWKSSLCQAEDKTERPMRPALRYGLTASKKVGNAVVRNRCRRRLRALAEDLLPKAAVENCDYVLIARAKCFERPWDALRQDLLYSLRRLGASKQHGPHQRGPFQPVPSGQKRAKERQKRFQKGPAHGQTK